MIEIEIPGRMHLQLSHLVLDYNGTLAEDGELLDGVVEKLEALSINLQLHVITADTHGTVEQKLSGLPCRLHIIAPVEQDSLKAEYIGSLGAQEVVAVGNGRNDHLMLKNAALGIALMQKEGLAVAAFIDADIICGNILDALDLLLKPDRLRATLRN